MQRQEQNAGTLGEYENFENLCCSPARATRAFLNWTTLFESDEPVIRGLTPPTCSCRNDRRVQHLNGAKPFDEDVIQGYLPVSGTLHFYNRYLSCRTSRSRHPVTHVFCLVDPVIGVGTMNNGRKRRSYRTGTCTMYDTTGLNHRMIRSTSSFAFKSVFLGKIILDCNGTGTGTRLDESETVPSSDSS